MRLRAWFAVAAFPIVPAFSGHAIAMLEAPLRGLEENVSVYRVMRAQDSYVSCAGRFFASAAAIAEINGRMK